MAATLPRSAGAAALHQLEQRADRGTPSMAASLRARGGRQMQRSTGAADMACVQRVQWFHLTAAMSKSMPELCRQDTGAWLWAHMRQAFPDAIAALLMPDHPHLIVATREPEQVRQRLARLLGQLGRAFGVEGQSSRVPDPAPIRERLVLARQVRYVALNPCRERLVTCPLAWLWSTHRDVVGASVDPWVTAERLAAALESSPRGFASRHHAYVSGDPHAHVGGTPLPIPAQASRVPTVPLRTIAEAVAAATRQPVLAMRTRGPVRALFVALAIDQGWDLTRRLAEVCGCCRRTITNLARDVDPAVLHAARLCLGDARLQQLPTGSLVTTFENRETRRA